MDGARAPGLPKQCLRSDSNAGKSVDDESTGEGSSIIPQPSTLKVSAGQIQLSPGSRIIASDKADLLETQRVNGN